MLRDHDRPRPGRRLGYVVLATRPVALALVAFAATWTASCSLGIDTLGGREKCWPESDRRAPSLWRGSLRLDATGASLATPEGDTIPLAPGALQVAGNNLVRGSDVVATVGDDVTLFGGAGADGVLVVCAVEENRGQT